MISELVVLVGVDQCFGIEDFERIFGDNFKEVGDVLEGGRSV